MEVLLTKQQYIDYVNFIDSPDGVIYEQGISMIKIYEYNEEIVVCTMNMLPENELILKFKWLIGVISNWYDYNRKQIKS